MHLPLADNIKPERTRNRLPNYEPLRLGLYAEQQGSLERLSYANDIWRTEIRLGAQTSIDPRMPLEQRERIHRDTKGLIMRHVYGPIYNELQLLGVDLMDAGLYRGTPAYDRGVAMMDVLGEAFRGNC